MKSPHLDAAWLRQKYEVEGLSTYEIGELIGRDPKSVYRKLRDFGIPTRPRGRNLRGADNYWAQPGRSNPMQGRRHTPETRARLSEVAQGRPGLRGARNGMFGQGGAANANFRGGISPERQRVYASSDWKFLERAVLERDAETCRRCTNSDARPLHIHHIVPWSESVELRLAINNLVTLCSECHRWVHGTANVAREWLAHSSPSLSSSPVT